MVSAQFNLDIYDEVIVDSFAGGGGASTGIEEALGRPVDVAINHDPEAVALHQANHPKTRHYVEDVFKVCPGVATRGRRVGAAWFSPDCKHFSKAKGKKPRSKKIRGLAWVVLKWAGHRTASPRVIFLENVEEFQDWGPLLPDGTPCERRKGRTFRKFVRALEKLGYAVEWRELRACDYGAPTIRKRLYLIARRDGRPIVWPEPTHGDPSVIRGTTLKPWRTAAECIDWSLPCPSIFLTKEEARAYGVRRPLKEATMRRIYRGVMKFVIEAQEPFIVPVTHQGGDRVEALSEPFRTITGAHRGEKAIAVPFVTEHANASTQRIFPADQAMRTQCAEVKGGHFALVAAFLAKFRFDSAGVNAASPMPTITAGSFIKRPAGAGHAMGLVASHLTKFYGTNTGQQTNGPLHSVTAQGLHLGEVRAFLTKYYGTGEGQEMREPIHTIPTHDRFGLVMVEGEPYAIADIGMRMLSPRELYRGQGFPESYRIQIEVEKVRHGKTVRVPLSTEAQVRMCGNSVCPPVARALVAANVPEMSVWNRREKEAYFRKRTAAVPLAA